MGLSSVVKGRAMQQASANTETQSAKVVKTYLDAQGNVTAADVLLDGQTRPLVRVPNSSGIRLWNKMPVTINWAQGSRHAPHIFGASGSLAGATVQAASGSGTTSGSTSSGGGSVDLSGTGLLVVFPDESLPGAYTEQPGANVLFVDIDPVGDGSGSGPIGGTRTIHAKPLVVTTLPDTAGLLDGTCVDLLNGDGEADGMYRLAAGVWVRRDTPGTGSGGSGVTSADRTRWNNAGTVAAAAATDATQALSDAADADADAETAITAASNAQTTANGAASLAAVAATAASAAQTTANTAQTEITNARTREVGSGFAAQTFANLKAHFAALWAALGTRTADPASVPGGYILTASGAGGVVFAQPTSSSGTGTVTSIDVSGGTTGLTASGGAITGAGTITLDGAVVVAHGGTGGTTPAEARTNLAAAPLAWRIVNVAADFVGQELTILKTDASANSVIVAVHPGSSDTLHVPSGASSLTSQWQSLRLRSTGTAWEVA